MNSVSVHLQRSKMPFRDHIYGEIAIDNTTAVKNPDASGLAQLREKIVEVAKKQPYWGEKRPIKWLLLADVLEREREKRPQMTVTEVEKHGKELGITTKDEIVTFLTFHHSLGDLIFLNEDRLRDTVILSPQWLSDVFRYNRRIMIDAKNESGINA